MELCFEVVYALAKCYEFTSELFCLFRENTGSVSVN